MITVQADANKMIMPGGLAEGMDVMDSNDNAFAYMVDALAAISIIVAYAEKKYGPVVTDAILLTLEGKTIRNKINKERSGKNEDQTEDCPGC